MILTFNVCSKFKKISSYSLFLRLFFISNILFTVLQMQYLLKFLSGHDLEACFVFLKLSLVLSGIYFSVTP